MTGAATSPVDLHLHTTFSDGDDTPEDLAELCAQAGVRVAACTDHDSVGGVAKFAKRAALYDITCIPGCEVTAVWQGAEVHCLIYFIDPGDAVLRERLDRVRHAELEWWREWFELVGELGAPVTWADVEARFGRERVPYIGDLIDLFLCSMDGDARFDRYPRHGRHDAFLADWSRPGKPLHKAKPWRPGLADVVGWAADAGGVAVLAHPARTLGADTVSSLVSLRRAGLAGIEVYSTWHRPEEIRELVQACGRHDLVATFGSDYHGPRLKPWVPRPGHAVLDAPNPLSILDDLKKRTG